jgi:hypothetical protein
LALGVVFSSVGAKLRLEADGKAVDAMNYYNDAVGSLGATCNDLRFPPPSDFAPPPPNP